MGRTFAEKFEEALAERREQEPNYGLRTLARILADGDRDRIETIRRRLNKYRPPTGGGAAATKPTEPTRREIEHALGLEVDALKPDAEPVAANVAMIAIPLDYDLLAQAITRREASVRDRVGATA